MNTVTADVTPLAENYGLIQLMHDSDTYQQTLLLVDDEKNVLNALRRLFYGADYQVVTASSGEEALLMMEQYSPDMIISDVRMPGMNGVELLVHIAEKYPDTERVLLTGYSDIESTIDAINSGGISQYIQKPWNDEKLLKLVDKTLSYLDLKQHNESLQATVRSQNEQLKSFNQQLEAKVEKGVLALTETHRQLVARTDALKQSYHNFVELFLTLMKSRLGDFYQDDDQASRLALDIGQSLGLDIEDLQALHFAAKLRHIGLLELDDSVIKTPYEALTPEQQKQLQQYPVIANDLLCSQPFLAAASDIILMHKEQLNGKGYPHKLVAEEISLPAKILAVVNDYLALINGAITAEPLTITDAVNWIAQREGEQYAAEAVAALIYLVENDRHAINELRLEAAQLQPGMVLSRDFHNANGGLLLAKGSKLNPSMITRIGEITQHIGDTPSLYIYSPKEPYEISSDS
ncbi:HD domain-containing phosphohydrolase [Oceanicoccus sagamiensis]|uniref:Two-component system response regulator n=1 Tax=Oceanicoccus sagamiensis TaxID=716816 RepID=A0A1X9NBC2_9GAMM|nr:HD domain-containing phosphohydrolase [Oceanicoccus sagamiensis]ARN73215.1 hypothetical protein BST96_03290 [Oceanicoccus sagamiensis]